jgi:hypothetical protein
LSLELSDNLRTERSQLPLPVIGIWTDAMSLKPAISLRKPILQHVLGNRVPSPPGDERDRSRLRPVWQAAFNDIERLPSVKNLDPPR